MLGTRVHLGHFETPCRLPRATPSLRSLSTTILVVKIQPASEHHVLSSQTKTYYPFGPEQRPITTLCSDESGQFVNLIDFYPKRHHQLHMAVHGVN